MTAPSRSGTKSADTGSLYRWYVVFICMVAYVLSYIDRQILALLIDPIRADLGLSDTQFSLILGFAFSLFYAVMGIPIAMLSDRKSRPLIISTGIFIWSLAATGCGLARNFLQLFLARMAVGIGEAALSPAAYSMIADLFPKEKLGRALGVFTLGSFIGGGLALTIGGAVIAAIARTGDLSLPLLGTLKPWQLTFFIVGTPGVFVAALFFLTVRDPHRKEAIPAFAEGRQLRSAPATPSGDIRLKDTFAYMARNRKTFLAHFSGFACSALALFGIMSWSPAFYMRHYGLAAETAGLYLGVIMLLFNTLGALSSGWLADMFQKQGHADAAMRAGMWGGIGLVLPVLLFPLADDLHLSLTLFAVASFFASFPIATSATALQLLAPNRMRAQLSALFLFVSNIFGLGVGTTVIALITDHVFADETAVGLSVALVCSTAAFLQAIILGYGLKFYRASIGAAVQRNACGV